MELVLFDDTSSIVGRGTVLDLDVGFLNRRTCALAGDLFLTSPVSLCATQGMRRNGSLPPFSDNS